MKKDLTTSAVDRQNILNNPYAIAEIENVVGLRGIPFEGKTVVLTEQAAFFFGVSVRTVKRYIADHGEELSRNGYETIRGNRLKSLKESIQAMNGRDINVPTISKASVLSIFSFKAFLNLAMLLSESESAKMLRGAILDVVMDAIYKRSGGQTKYINQRDEEFIHSFFAGESYRREFTDALRDFVEMGNFKYPLYTDKVYVSIFKEKSREYRAILRLQETDKTRDTFYSEILDLISAYEYGFSEWLKREAAEKKRKLTPWEAEALFASFERQPHWKPLFERARAKMASRDLAFRDALHERLINYITPLQRDEFERFLGEKSRELSERLEEAKDVLKRLKDR